jgi:hypothetical protein
MRPPWAKELSFIWSKRLIRQTKGKCPAYAGHYLILVARGGIDQDLGSQIPYRNVSLKNLTTFSLAWLAAT